MGYRVWDDLTGRDEDQVYGRFRNWDVITDELGRALVKGQRVADKWPEVIYDVESNYLPVDTFKISTDLIVSKCMAQIIAKYVPSDDVEYLPVTINYKEQPYGEYYILHPLVVLDAVDRGKSQYNIRKGKLRDITKLALDKYKLGNKPLVQLDASTWLVCVSDELAHAIEQSGMHGVVFPTPEQWRPY